MADVAIVQLPSPPHKNVFREWSGGMGTALPSPRPTHGHDQKYYDIPFSAYLYIARRLELAGVSFTYSDLQGRERIELDEFDALLREAKPRILVTQVNLPSLEHDLDLLRRAREAVPALRIVLVGATGKWFSQRILADGLAEVVMNEAEELLVSDNIAAMLAGTAPDALQACSVWRDGKVVSLPARQIMKDLDFVDFPAYQLLDFARYESDYYGGKRFRYATVFTSKGCPYRCGYCPYPYGFGRKLIYRSPSLVGADIERLKKEFDVGQILFRDQVFTINAKHARSICDELVRRDLGIVWICETRYDLVTPELLDAMYAAGCCEIHYGLESADAEMFAKIAKSDGPKSLDLFKTVIGWTKARGIRTHVHLIVGMPDESRASVRNTTRWLRDVRPDSVQLAYFVPYPGTPMFDELRQSGELGDIDRIDWEALGAFENPVLPSRHLSIDEIRRARHRISVDWRYSFADRVAMKLRRMVGAPAQ
jgi:anaerobic magnesium-protoporphyrin IX monomethyl ester cyclase